MKISTRLLIIKVIVLVIAFTSVIVILNHSMRRQALHEAESKIRIIADQYFAIHTYFSTKLKPAVFKLTEPVRSEKYFDPIWMSSTHAIREMAKDIRKKRNSEYYVKDAAINARNPENEATPFEKKFILELIENPKLQDRSSIQILDGKSYFVYLRRGEQMEESCLRCHSIAQNAPGDMVKIYGSKRGFNRKKGELVSAISIRVPLSATYGYANYFSIELSILLFIIIVVVFFISTWINRRYIYNPLFAIHDKVLEISDSESNEKLGEEIPLPPVKEFKDLAMAFNKVSVRLRYHIDHMDTLVKERTAELAIANEQLKIEISERELKDKALRETNEFLDTLIKSSPLAIISVDLQGTILTWNEAAEMIFGWQKSEVIGHLAQKFHDTNGYAQRALKGEVFTDIELTPIKKDGLPVDISFSTAPLRDNNGNVTGIIVIIADITERKKMEKELLKAQKLESVGALAGGIAHNFNNILTSVSGNIQLAKMKIEPETKAFDLLSSAEKSLIKAQELSVQLLTFAKGGAPQKKIISISGLIKTSCIMANQGSKSECEFSIEKDLWQVEADIGQLSLVFSNIVINASQAMPQGGIIRVAANNLIVDAGQDLQLEPGKYVHISVEDQGPGIPENNLSKIFDPYFTTKVESSGLGLAAAYSIIKNHNGHIYAKSLPGEGTVFHIYLPAFGDFIAAEEEAELLTGYGSILVMDDDKMLKIMVEEMLNVLGYESEFANDGDEAVKMYKKALESGKPYDAVMLDLTIPGGMGGKEAVKILLETDPNLKAIVFSGYSDDPVMSNHRKYGFKGMLSKPFNLESLGKALHDVLKN